MVRLFFRMLAAYYHGKADKYASQRRVLETKEFCAIHQICRLEEAEYWARSKATMAEVRGGI